MIKYIRRKNMKTLRVRVDEEGKIIISGPQQMSKEELNQLVEKNKNTIQTLKDNHSIYHRRYKNQPEKDRYWLLGKEYHLIYKNNKAILGEYEVKISKNGFTKDRLKEIYRLALEKVLEEIRLECYDLVGYKEKVLSFYQYKRRYGTCFPKRGEIRLSYDLARRSIEEIRFVYLHELMHFKHPNHSKEFYKDLKSIISDYYRIEKMLKE
ncbi:MAG: DUF45 domain-containing protein [Tissierellia bacterium]|nr:DUF45 domain-containing protein [Tissierellia bacterium]